MQSGGARGNGDGVPRFDAKHFPGRRGELAEHDGSGVWRRGFEVLAGRGERPLEGRGQCQAADPFFERLQAAAVVFRAHGRRREQRLGGSHHEPQGEETLAARSPRRLGDEGDEAILGGCVHATRRCTAAVTWSGKIASRQRWWPSGHRSVPMAEQGRQSRSSLSTAACLVYGKNPNGSTVGPKSATTPVPTPVAMCITPVSPETSTLARARQAPVSCSVNSPAAPPALASAASASVWLRARHRARGRQTAGGRGRAPRASG